MAEQSKKIQTLFFASLIGLVIHVSGCGNKESVQTGNISQKKELDESGDASKSKYNKKKKKKTVNEESEADNSEDESDANSEDSAPDPGSTAGGDGSTPSRPASPPPSAPASAGCIDGDDFTCKAEAAIVKYTNELRAKRGLPPFTHDLKMSFVSRDWSIKQGAAISHAGFPGARATVYRDNFPGEGMASISAENVAMQGSSGNDPDEVGRSFVSQWENSPGHLANMVGGHRGLGAGISCPGKTSGGSPSGGTSGGGGLGGLFGGFGGGSGCTATQIFTR